MKIAITDVTPENVTLNGQVLARSYVESILLPLMVAAQGQNHAGIIKVSEAFDTAGLNLEGVPEALRTLRGHQVEKRAEQERKRAEGESHARRCYEPTAQEIAEANAARERKAQEIRDHGARLRALRGR
jgi:hypothetical protein